MKIVFISFLSCLCSVLFAQEYSSREIVTGMVTSMNENSPIDVTKEHSTVELKYDGLFRKIVTGEKITKIIFKGYNTGKTLQRHVKVYMKEALTSTMGTAICVFDGECNIAQGGSKDECITLLDIPFNEPFECQDGGIRFFITIESSGDATDKSLFFESSGTLPVATLTVNSEVVTLTGKVVNQDTQPINNAVVTLIGAADSVRYKAVTDKEGYYSCRIERGNQMYFAEVSAAGFPLYKIDKGYFSVNTVDNMKKDFILYGTISFKNRELSTIIVPSLPSPEWGDYYRLNKREGRKIIFVRELQPKPNTPYVLFPKQDFQIMTKDYNLSEESGSTILPFENGIAPTGEQTSIPYAAFIGSYESKELGNFYETEYPWLFDTSPDCTPYQSGAKARIGALRAYLLLYNYNLYPHPEYLFIDETEDIRQVNPSTKRESSFFDLQGRRLQGKPAKGVYIRDGRKYVLSF